MLEVFRVNSAKFDEGMLYHEGDVIVGANSKLDYGVSGRKVVIGERCHIKGDVVCEEVRLDSWVTIDGSVFCKGDAYIGEFSSINGKLVVYGNLEIGRNVRIKEGFEAKGLITIQDPLPIIIFLFVYILELLRLGRIEEVEKLFEEDFENPLIIPENSKLSLEFIELNANAEIASSRVVGNLRGKNILLRDCEIFGSVKGRDVAITSSKVHGAVEGRKIYIARESEIYGFVRGEEVFMEEGCSVEGSIVGRKGVWIKENVEIPELIKIDELGQRKVQEDVSEPVSGDRVSQSS